VTLASKPLRDSVLLGAQKWGAPALSAAVVVCQPDHLLLGAQKWGEPALSAAIVVCQPDHLFQAAL
jgi:hypothetical protein